MNINATLIAQALIFTVFVYICYKYVWPSILSIMEEREKKLADGLEAAKKAGIKRVVLTSSIVSMLEDADKSINIDISN